MYDYLKLISEENIKESADVMIRHGEINNAFTNMLKSSLIFRQAGMTPLFVYNEQTNELMCVAKETFLKKLH